ncbi:4'-phosphopantetheinyl transferase superfamily protein [Micromonospora sp. WMMA1363]|uniref:4'-phosphopantetheinyl transferase family protein n=1 Tax=Micromonospora sp. WMMA1363 TaxID=3053985 RepID=UPI00259CA766|nr:4'-phosphopantetheinyl transferase superfamily protein [Micromonospora sp. WMMA1363]MDM4718647.1 4'-phosphopantetheinyl transferase superfamily protein [Micromonospora sp. WMMA1363]
MATGLPAEGTCLLWWAPIADPGDAELLSLLDEGERQRHAGFGDPAGRNAFLTARAVTRLALGLLLGVAPEALRFRATCKGCGGPHGKPTLWSPAAPARFSVSHSGRWCVIAVARGTEVGVDVERIGLRRDTIPLRALASEERKALVSHDEADRLPVFVRYWTRKEALLKATGDGLMVDPAAIMVTRPDQPAGLLRWAAEPAPPATPHLADLAAPPGYAAALASLGRPLAASIRDGGLLVDRFRRSAGTDTTPIAGTVPP